MSAKTNDRLAADVRDARRDVIASLIAVRGHLDTPYPDDPRWTPWTRFVERSLQRLDESMASLAELVSRLQVAEAETARWLAWSGDNYPDDSPGDVIAFHADGTIVLDDGITTWNPLRALAAAEARVASLRESNVRALEKKDRWQREAHAAEAQVDALTQDLGAALDRAEAAEAQVAALTGKSERQAINIGALYRQRRAAEARAEAAEHDLAMERSRLEREREARKAAEALNADEVVRARTNLEARVEAAEAGYPVRLSKYEARFLQKQVTMQVDYPDLEPEHQALYDKLEAVL